MTRKLSALILVAAILIGCLPLSASALTYEQSSKAQPEKVWNYLMDKIGNPYGVAGIMGNISHESGLIPNNLNNSSNRSLGLSDEEYTRRTDNGTYTKFASDGAYYGLAQWGYSTRKQGLLNLAKKMDGSVGSLEVQLAFIIKELEETFPSVLKSLKNATSVREASDVFLAKFEGAPNKSEANKQARADLGQTYFDAYAKIEQPTPEPEPEPEPDEYTNPFVDVSEDEYYYEAVLWAYYAEPQITNGTDKTHFSPDNDVTRAQAVTFLWRAMGEPEPESTENPFTDVKEGEYYYKAAIWAVEQGITKGTSKTKFSPKGTLTTAHIITFIYRAVNKGADGWYEEAANWAATETLILSGTPREISDKVKCPRCDVVTFLYGAAALMLSGSD